MEETTDCIEEMKDTWNKVKGEETKVEVFWKEVLKARGEDWQKRKRKQENYWQTNLSII